MTGTLFSQSLARTDNEGRLLWSREEFLRLHEDGLFSADNKLELIRGEIYHEMTMLGPHRIALYKTTEVLKSLFGPGFLVFSQMPLLLNENDLPEPDISVVQGEIEEFRSQFPASATLVVEVSDSTLKKDKTLKASVYAEAGIQEYWVVNVIDRVVEVHRQPGEIQADAAGFGYRSITRHSEHDKIDVLAVPGKLILVGDLL